MADRFLDFLPGVRSLDLGPVNVHLLDTHAGRVLVDTGFPPDAEQILAALGELGGAPVALVVVTHAHPDHSGGAEAVRQALGVPVAMHPIDAALVRTGVAGRTLVSRSDVDPAVAERYNAHQQVPPVVVDVELTDGAAVPGFDELTVHLAPGHCAGQVVLEWGSRRLLVAADSSSNRDDHTTLPVVAEDYPETAATLATLAGLPIDAAVFGHGVPITSGAAERLAGAAA